MRYALVATVNYLLRVDLASKTVIPIEKKRPEYYGISWFPNSEELVLSHSSLDNSSLIGIESYAQSETGYLSHGSFHSKPFLSQPHQIICAPDGRVICTNTGRNVVTVVDLQKPGHYQEIGVSSARWDRLSMDLKTGDHINSVFLKGNQLFVICHRFDKGSFLAVFDYPSLELISLKKLSGLSGLHNILVTDEGQYISCHSEIGALVDVNSSEVLWQSGTAIYTRGLAASSEYLIIGESQKGTRETRNSSLSALWIVERNSWKLMDYICLGNFGCVHEVRLLDEPDEAHHGHTFAGLNNVLQKNLYDDLTRESISISDLTMQSHKYWQNYHIIFGESEVLPDGMRKTGASNLCLAIRNEHNNTSANPLIFDYVLEPTGEVSHVSAVLGYSNKWDDTNMLALTLQRGPETAILSLLHHDGNEWDIIEGINAFHLPLKSTFKVIISNQKINVVIGKKNVLSFNPEKLGIKKYKTGLGIRWINALVKPNVN